MLIRWQDYPAWIFSPNLGEVNSWGYAENRMQKFQLIPEI